MTSARRQGSPAGCRWRCRAPRRAGCRPPRSRRAPRPGRGRGRPTAGRGRRSRRRARGAGRAPTDRGEVGDDHRTDAPGPRGGAEPSAPATFSCATGPSDARRPGRSVRRRPPRFLGERPGGHRRHRPVPGRCGGRCSSRSAAAAWAATGPTAVPNSAASWPSGEHVLQAPGQLGDARAGRRCPPSRRACAPPARCRPTRLVEPSRDERTGGRFEHRDAAGQRRRGRGLRGRQGLLNGPIVGHRRSPTPVPKPAGRLGPAGGSPALPSPSSLAT